MVEGGTSGRRPKVIGRERQNAELHWEQKEDTWSEG